MLAQSSIGLFAVGFQFSNFTDRIGELQTASNSKFTQKTYAAVAGGMMSRLHLNGRHHLNIELLFSMRGANYSHTENTLNGAPQGSPLEYYIHYSTHYIEMPLLYSFDLTKKKSSSTHVFFSSGISVGINVIAKRTQNQFTPGVPWLYPSPAEESYTEAKLDQINHYILNYSGGLDLEFGKRKTRYCVYGRFNHSLTNVFNREYPDMKTKLITYGIGFGMRRYLSGNKKKKEGD